MFNKNNPFILLIFGGLAVLFVSVAILRVNFTFAEGIPTVTLTQTIATTTMISDNTSQPFTISWNSTNSTSCTVSRQRTHPEIPVNNNWASGLAGSKLAAPPIPGKYHWWIDCIGPGGTARADIYHTVITEKPNIVVIMTDDQDDMGSIDTMPNVKSLLIDQGTRFTNSFVSFPLCCPSRASFLTGQFTHNHNIWGNGPEADGGHGKFLPLDKNTLPVWLQKAGYKTAFFGKYLNGYGDNVTSPQTYIPPGWNEWQAVINVGNFFNYLINHNGQLEQSDPSKVEDYMTDSLNKRSLNFVQTYSSSQPFFIYLAHKPPHAGTGTIEDTEIPVPPAPRHKGFFKNLPLPIPPNFNEADTSDKPTFLQVLPILNSTSLAKLTTNFRSRRESLLSVDEGVAQLVSELEKKGILENTIIVFTSDNGFFQGEHRRSQGKKLVYEESIRVPLIIRGPGIPKGVTKNELVNNLDLVSTIVDSARATPERALDGKSFLQLLKGTDTNWRTVIGIEGSNLPMLALGESQPVPYDGTIIKYSGVRTKDYKYVEHKNLSTGSIEKEFYDLKNDPYELESKPNDPLYRDIISNLVTSNEKLKVCKGEECWVTTPLPERPKPTVTFTQSTETTTSDGTTGQSFTITWNSTNATSCVIQKNNPLQVITSNWATGISGSKIAAPPRVGVHRWWIDCTGPGGVAHAEFEHTVLSRPN